jgi:hypothetical protein
MYEVIGPYGNNVEAMAQQITSGASNILVGSNPTFTISNFLAVFPQFGDTQTPDNNMLVPITIQQMYITMANASILQVRWHSMWQYAMCLYTAHFCTLWLQTQSGPNSTAAQVVATAQAMFPESAVSAGDVSGSYDISSVAGDLPGWAMWKTTSFGIQLASMARMVGRGGMVVR